MLPIQISMMQNFLLHRGYKNYTVGRMKTWDLVVAYSFEKKQPNSIYLPIRPAGGASGEPEGRTGPAHLVDTYV